MYRSFWKNIASFILQTCWGPGARDEQPATAFGADFALTIPDTTQIDNVPADALPARAR
jgi:hypothetical protein